MKQECKLKESISFNPKVALEQLVSKGASLCRKIELANNEAQVEYYIRQLPKIDKHRCELSK
ncbi:MAG: hypothetical protein L3J41_15825 [Melioribacteraceae bacterium]|nr:hypothetical protein [Melioribacteraceae bacterium]